MKCITLSSGKQVCFDSTPKAQDGKKIGSEERIKYLMDKGKDYDNLDFAIHQPLRFIGHSIAPNAIHGTDTYKLPNHMTFSNESKYSNDQHKGGTWGTTPDGRYTFTPTEWNIKNAGGKENLERWWNDGPNSEGAHGNILKFQPGGKTLVVPNSSVKLPPLSKEQQLAQNARMQGDTPTAKSIIKQQERMREEEALKKKLGKQPTIKLSEAQKEDIAAQNLKQSVLDDMIRRNQYTLSNPDDQSYMDDLQNVLSDAEQDIKNNDLGMLNAMLNVPTGLISGRYESPSQAIGRFAMRNNLNQLQNAMIDDQGNPTGLGMATDMFGPGLFLKGLNAVPKINPWRINPFAEKLKDVNKSYRVAGLDALEDFQNTGVLRSVRPKPEGALDEGVIVMTRPTEFPSFQKGFADMRFANPEGSVIFETSLPTFKRGEINPVTGKPIKGSHYAHRVINPETGQVMTEIPAKDIRVFGDKPHWLKGYQEINGPSKGILTSFEYNFNPKNLKTESGLEWIKQWHSHPDFTKRYSANKNIFTGDADNFKNLILQNLDDYQDKNYLDLLKDKGFKDFIESKLSTGGVSYGTPDNIYINKTAFFPFNKIGKESTRAHELSHLTDINGLTLTISDMEDLLKPFGYNPTQYYQKFPTPKHRKKGEGYYLNPTEIRARMNEGRFKFGLMPSDNFTPEMFDEVSKSHNWYGMNNYIKDKKGFIDLMNKFWAVPAGAVGVGAAAKSVGSKEPMQRKGGFIKAQEGSKNTKNYQPSKDVIISGNEYSDYDKRASDLEAKYRQCHEGDLECLGSANQFYNQYTARQAGLPTTWEMYQNRGVNSVNAWDVAALPNTTILYNFNKQGPFQNLSEEERMRIYKSIPLGATISYMGGDTGSHRSGVESGHKKAGLPDTTHAAKVIGFSEDGFPIIFDYGKTFTLRPDILGGTLGGYTPQIVSFPNEVKDAVFENINKPGVGRALSLDPKSVIVDPKLGAFKKTGKGKLFSPESLRLPIGSDAYEASKGFAKTINEFRDTAVTKLGIDPEYYDSYLAPAAFGIAGQESEFGTKGEPVAEFADRWIPGLHNKSIGPLQIDRYIVNSNDKNNKRLQSLWKEYAGINHEDDLRDPDKAMKAAIIMMNYNRYSMDRAFNQNKKQPEYGLSEPELLKLAYYYNNPSSVPVALGESNYARNVNDMSGYLLPSDQYTLETKELSYPKHILKAPWAPRPPYKKEKGGKNINNTGYLDNSNTKHNPYNVIPSNNITMDGVSIPLLLMPDGDKARVVMPHSGEYNFPNSQYVTEIPLAQKGRKVYPQPTTQDSVTLYKNQLLKDAFYKNNPNYKRAVNRTSNADLPNIIYEMDPNDLKRLINVASSRRIPKEYAITFNKQPNQYKSELEKRFKKLSNNIYSAGDIVDGTVDVWFNPDAPPSYFSPTIKPKEWISYDAQKYGDSTDVPMYDPLAIKPFYMRTPQEKIEWEKKYGKPKSKPKPQPQPQPKPNQNVREQLELEPLQSKEPSRLTSNVTMEPRSFDINVPSTPQSSNEEYNREYSIRIPTIDINKRQVAPRVNRVLGKNVINPKNQYQRSIEFGSREVPIINEYELNKLMINMGMEPKFQPGGQAQAKKKTYPPGYHKTPPPNFNIPVSQRDSVANYAYNRATYEGNKGSNSGTGLSNYGYNESQEPFNKKPARFTPPSNEQQAVDLYMKEVAPKVDYFPTAAEQTIAGDLYYNAGRDIRIYMLDQYLKSIGQTGGLPNRKDYNKDVKTEAWTPDLQNRLDAEWNKYKGEIYKLPTQKRRELMNNGRDYYYKNTYVDPEAKKANDFSGQGVTYWSKSRQQKNPNDIFDSDSGWYYQRGPDGTLSPQYQNTWYGRQHATDLYEYVNPNAVNDPTSKYYPKRQPGGQNVKKGPGPFLIPEPRAQFKSIPIDNLADPRLRAYQDSVIQNNKSIEALQNFNKAYNTKQPYVATPENLTDDYKNSGVKQQAKYTNPKNTKNYLQPSKKIDDLNEEQRANLLEAFNTQQEGTPINLPTALYYADLFNNNTYKNEDIWFDYHTNPIQPYHLAPMEQIATKNVSPIPVNDERVLPSMNFPIPTFAGTMYTPTTEGLTIPVPTVNIVKETVPPRVNAKRRQNKVNVGSNTKTKVKFDIDQREILSREDLDSLRGSVGLDPKGYESGGKIIKLSTGKIIKIK